jgi:hypothetical protein
VSWVRTDDSIGDDTRVASVGVLGAGVLVLGLAYSNRNLTDGWIPDSILRRYLSDGSTGIAAPEARAQLLQAGILSEEARDGIPGVQIHADYVRLQPTREQVLKQRKGKSLQKTEAGRLGGVASGEARRKQRRSSSEAVEKHGQSTAEAPYPDPDPKKDKSTDAVASASPHVQVIETATHAQLCKAYDEFLRITPEHGPDLKEDFKEHLAKQLRMRPESPDSLRKAMDAVEHVSRLSVASSGRRGSFVGVGQIARAAS